MNTFQTFLALGSIIILSIYVLHTNEFIVEANQSMVETTAMVPAVGVAQAMLEEIKSKAFDEKIYNGPADNPSDLTSNPYLGPDAGESVGNYDDIDDYDGYNQNMTLNGLNFNVQVSVGYVNKNDLDHFTGSQPFFLKRTVVQVDNAYLSSPVTMHYIFTYH